MSEEQVWHVVAPDRIVSQQVDEQLRRRVFDGTITKETLVWKPGMASWEAAGTVPGLFVPPLPIVGPGLVTEALPPVQVAEGFRPPPIPMGEGNDETKASGSSPPDLESAGRSKSPASYFMRHWRGQLSLGVSYWVNGVLLGISAGFATTLLSLPDITRAPRLLSSSYAALGLLLLLISIWQFVGTWRSAQRRIVERRQAGKEAFWAHVVRVVTVMQICLFGVNVLAYNLPNIVANLQIAFGDDPIPHHVLRLLNEGTEIALTGGFDFGTASDLRTLLGTAPNVKTLDFNSLGGRVAEAEHVRNLIRERGLATYTIGMCASACTIAYLAGNPRYLGPGGKLAFHQYSFPGLSPDQQSALNLAGQQWLVAAGVSSGFAAKAFSTPSSRMLIPDTTTLLAEHVVTQIVDGQAFASAANGGLTPEYVGKILDAIPGFAALKRGEPAIYAQAARSIIVAGGEGKGNRQTWMQASELLRLAVTKYRGLAADAVQVEIAALLAEEGRYLAVNYPDACLAMLNRTSQPGPYYTAWLSPDLRTRDNTLVGLLITSGSTAPSNVVTPAESAAAEFMPLWLRVRDDGFDLSFVGQAPRSLAEQRSACLALSAFMQVISQLPSSKAGPLMRRLAKTTS